MCIYTYGTSEFKLTFQVLCSHTWEVAVLNTALVAQLVKNLPAEQETWV